MLKHRIVPALFCLIIIVCCTGCSKVKLTTGLHKNDFAKIDGTRVSMEMADLLLAEQKFSYEKIFNANVWTEQIEGMSMENYVKNTVKDTISHILYVNIIAGDMGISLTESEQNGINKAAKEYMNTLSKDTQYSFTEETVKEYYKWLLLAEKTFESVTDSVDKEVSADEARIIDVQYIFISTKRETQNGEEELTDSEKLRKKKYIAGLLESINSGEDFVVTAKQYSDDEEFFKEFGTGDTDEAFEKAAFKLETGQISGVVEGSEGYYLIKCTNDNVESNYEDRKEKIILNRRKHLFEKDYLEYVSKYDMEYNHKFYTGHDIKKIKNGSGQLYEIYKKYFISTQLD